MKAREVNGRSEAATDPYGLIRFIRSIINGGPLAQWTAGLFAAAIVIWYVVEQALKHRAGNKGGRQ